MFQTLIKKMFGSRNERTLRRMQKTVDEISHFSSGMAQLTDEALAAKTVEFKQRLANGTGLDELLPEAFAVVREVSTRVLGLRHFDVQMLGGIVLHEGNIAEMRTGEGKTLVATLPAYLNALTGHGVHVVTVNDYLAKRDSEWMTPIFSFLGLTVSVIIPDMPHEEKQKAYQADVVYGTNNEFGFDYLRDNMAFSLENKVQRELNFAIVDEVDSILIDEARTPLIISGAAEGSSAMYVSVGALMPALKKAPENGEGDYVVDEKHRQAHLTEEGHQHVEVLLVEAGLLAPGESLYHASHAMLLHHVNAALKAHALFHRDVDYIVKDDQVVIVDEHTGRMMAGRRWSEGIHQAVEAKEGVSIQHENQTLASITFQNFFRMYQKLSGMTGTADTEAYEFQQIYNLEVVVIPTNQSMRRQDEADLVYLSQPDKYEAVIEDVKVCVAKGQPVLVGTASVEASELLSDLLNKAGVKHQVLNAKFHEKEAHIIAEAGRPGVVTIATNMAGRGTDIVLGGNLKAMLAALPEDASADDIESTKQAWQKAHDAVLDAGGLRIIGSERHESRRIDNQLRGRAGRQGDVGSTRFYLSLDDNLMRIFASERVAMMMRRLGMKPGEPIEHKLVTRAIENAQRKLEGHHFDVRKQLLEYDNVANNQRKVIYHQRATVMSMDDPAEVIQGMREEVIDNLINTYASPDRLEDEWDLAKLQTILKESFQIDFDLVAWSESHEQAADVRQKLVEIFEAAYQAKLASVGQELMANVEKSIVLQTIDHHWREHLAAMDYLRQGIHLRGYAQKDPKQEYKREAFTLFTALLDSIVYDIICAVYSFRVEEEPEAAEGYPPAEAEMVSNIEPIARAKVGRNDPCPCGAPQKYKNCHGRLV